MKLRNKRTGEIVDYISFEKGGGQISMYVFDTNKHYYYNSLAELNSEWEDVPEKPKEYWYMDYAGRIKAMNDANDEEDMARKEIGNYFDTKEEAEKAVDKLEAWKRLKDKGFEFEGYDDGYKHDFNSGHIEFYVENSGDVIEALDLLFGGEE